jgi:hypothetical protein
LHTKIATVAWALLCCLLGAARLCAQDQQPASSAPPVISTDRPAITDASTVVPSGYFVFENGFEETGSQGQSSFDFPETLVRFGLTSTTELRLDVPDYFANANTGRGFGSGWGDLGLGVKQQLVAGYAGFDASLIVELSFPTGANIISSHGYDPQFLLPWSHPLSKNWTAAGMFSILWPTEDGRRNLTGQASFLIDRQITGPWDAFIEYGGEFPERGGPTHIVHTGTSFKITPNQQIDFHVGFGVSAAAPGHFIGFGYSLQFDALHRGKAR